MSFNIIRNLYENFELPLAFLLFFRQPVGIGSLFGNILVIHDTCLPSLQPRWLSMIIPFVSSLRKDLSCNVEVIPLSPTLLATYSLSFQTLGELGVLSTAAATMFVFSESSSTRTVARLPLAFSFHRRPTC